MGYGMGQEDQRAKRKARLAARYGSPEGFGALGAVLAAAETLTEPTPVGLPVGTAQAPYIEPAPKKKGGRPKGSKNKRAE